MNKILFLAFATLSFLPGLTLAQASPSPGSPDAAGIEGTITAGPVRGGPEREGDPSSAPLAQMAFVVKQGDTIVTSFETDAAGHFRVTLPPGHYTVARKDFSGAVGHYGPFEVDVSEGKMSSVSWRCDTGMR